MKRCPRCGELKDEKEFNKNASTKDGLQNYCRPCKRDIDDEYHARLVPNDPEPSERKVCARCGENRPIARFARTKGRKSGVCPYCKACYRTRYHDKQNGVEIPADLVKLKDRQRYWQKRRYEVGRNQKAQRNKQKAKKKALNNLRQIRYAIKKKYGIGLEKIQQMLDDQRGVCALCDFDFGSDSPNGMGRSVWRTYHIDHDHETGEIRGLLCPHCNNILGQYENHIRHRLDLINKYLRR